MGTTVRGAGARHPHARWEVLGSAAQQAQRDAAAWPAAGPGARVRLEQHATRALDTAAPAEPALSSALGYARLPHRAANLLPALKAPGAASPCFAAGWCSRSLHCFGPGIVRALSPPQTAQPLRSTHVGVVSGLGRVCRVRGWGVPRLLRRRLGSDAMPRLPACGRRAVRLPATGRPREEG